MKSILFLFSVISINLYAQKDYNYLNYNDIYIQREGKTSYSKVKLSNIKSIITSEKYIGSNYKSKQYTSAINDKTITQISYDDGLQLKITEDNTRHNQFDIKSSNYKLIISDGKVISVGMKSDELKSIFPLSYEKREKITHWAGMNGKISFKVYLAFTSNNKVILEGSWIVFVLDKEDGSLERFLLYESE